MDFPSNDKVELKAYMNMFVAINMLTKMYSLDQAIDVLDIYFKTGDSNYLTTEDNIRDFVVSSNIRATIFPLMEGYPHLADFIDDVCTAKKEPTKGR